MELTDSRSGLSTHRAFDEALEREWNRSLRDGSYLSLLLLDFDHFRQFHSDDQHREGDRCLSRAAAAVVGALRVTDFAALYDLEDIAIILPATGLGGAAKAAEKVQAAVRALRTSPGELPGRHARITVSIGFATVSARPGATARMPEILRLGAFHALQKAKISRVPLWPPAIAAPAS